MFQYPKFSFCGGNEVVNEAEENQNISVLISERSYSPKEVYKSKP